MEWRIYFESYEQAFFYVKPILEIFVKPKNIKLGSKVKFQKKYKPTKAVSENLYKIIKYKDADIVITCVRDGVEYPIFIIEFSTAVYTEDHELQRADNFIASKESSALWIKISPTKKNSGSHGGNIRFDHREPYSLFLKKYGLISFHIEWETEEDNVKILKKHPIYKSFPDDGGFFLKKIFKDVFGFLNKNRQSMDSWSHDYTNKIKEPSLVQWKADLQLFDNYTDERKLNTSRTYWVNDRPEINENGYLEMTLRMGHAMDPGRGMLYYYSDIKDLSRDSLVSAFNCDTSKEAWFKG